MRGRYRAARDALADTLAAHAGGAAAGGGAPTRGCTWWPTCTRTAPPACRGPHTGGGRRYEAWLLSETRLEPGPGDGFVLGFSGHTLAELRQGAERLARAAADPGLRSA